MAKPLFPLSSMTTNEPTHSSTHSYTHNCTDKTADMTAQVVITPAVSIQHFVTSADGQRKPVELVYTDYPWAAINNTFSGCDAYPRWQRATQWLVISDESDLQQAARIITGCQSLAASAAHIQLGYSAQSIEQNSLLPTTETVVVIAAEAKTYRPCVTALQKIWPALTQPTHSADTPHLLWLPQRFTERTMPEDETLNALHWQSTTVVCDLNQPIDAYFGETGSPTLTQAWHGAHR